MQTKSQTEGQASPTSSELPAFAPQSGRKKRRRTLLILLVVAVAAVILVPRLLGREGRNADPMGGYIAEAVQKRDISVVVSGSAALQPADSYVVTALAGGEILSADFEEGDVVEKDALLYQIDAEDMENTIARSRLSVERVRESVGRAELGVERAQLSYDQATRGLEDLIVESTESGVVTELLVEEGDTIAPGQAIASVRDSATMTLQLPFLADDAAGFTIGQPATVTLDGSFETLDGTVGKIAPVDEVLAGNIVVRMVTIDVRNPGGIMPSSAASAAVGAAECVQSASFEYQNEGIVTALAGGEIAVLLVAEGDSVSKGQPLLRLDGEDLDQSIRTAELALRDAQAAVSDARLSLSDAELSLQNTIDQLDNYAITSPISGTIVEKNYKAGDKIDSGAAAGSLCTIFDLSYLTLTLHVDELDIAKIAVGQEVAITAEAVEGKSYTGRVTKVNINGTTVGGVTSYPVTIRIDDTGGLLPGMNVDVEIVVESKAGVISVPVSAIERGNRILVKTGEAVEGAGLTPEGLPAGYEYREVELGINDDDYIEITAGLEEGDEIAYAANMGTSLIEQMVGNMMQFSEGGGAGAPAGVAPSGGRGQ